MTKVKFNKEQSDLIWDALEMYKSTGGDFDEDELNVICRIQNKLSGVK